MKKTLLVALSLFGFAVSSVYADTTTYNQGKSGQKTDVYEQNATKGLGESNAKMKKDSGKMQNKYKDQRAVDSKRFKH